MKTVLASLSAASAALLLGACTGGPSLPSLSTGSLSETGATAQATPAAAGAAPQQAALTNDPTQRAFQVGSTSARAVKCGFYFDAVKLKQQFLAAEATLGTPVADMAKVEKIYDVSFNGITRAIAPQQDYCTEAKSKEIKSDLKRHLAGDYAPRAAKKVVSEGGFFENLFDGGSDEVDKGPKMGSNEWWDKQRDKAGK
jgi:hypothetical protein